MSDEQELTDRMTLDVTHRPLQSSGDECLRVASFGGPECGRDATLILDRKQLIELLDIANASLSGRVEIRYPGVQVKVMRRNNGTQYELWTLIGAEAKPESVPFLARKNG